MLSGKDYGAPFNYLLSSPTIKLQTQYFLVFNPPPPPRLRHLLGLLDFTTTIPCPPYLHQHPSSTCLPPATFLFSFLPPSFQDATWPFPSLLPSPINQTTSVPGKNWSGKQVSSAEGWWWWKSFVNDGLDQLDRPDIFPSSSAPKLQQDIHQKQIRNIYEQGNGFIFGKMKYPNMRNGIELFTSNCKNQECSFLIKIILLSYSWDEENFVAYFVWRDELCQAFDVLNLPQCKQSTIYSKQSTLYILSTINNTL